MINLEPGVLSPYNTCLDYQRFVSTLAKNPDSPPTTRVSPDGSLITFGEVSLSIPNLRQGLHRLLSEVQAELKEVCYGDTFDLKIPDNVADDWAEETRGYSWVHNEPFLTDRRCLLKAMVNDTSTNLAGFPTSATWEALKKFTSINQKLCILCFLLPGQSPRGAEFVDYKIANSTRGRNLFRDRRDIYLANRRNKTEAARKKETFLPVKLPPELASVFQTYLLLIRPAEEDLAYILRGAHSWNTYREYLWVDRCDRISSEMFYTLFQTFMREYCGADIGLHDWRQISVGIARVYLGSGFEVDEDEFDVLAAQRGHTARMAQFKYATEVGHIACMSSDLLLRFSKASEAWWSVIGFHPHIPALLPLRLRKELEIDATGQELSKKILNDVVANEMSSLKEELSSFITDAVKRAIAELLEASRGE